MLDTSLFTKHHWWSLGRCDMAMPIPLHGADFDKPFVYDRAWGLFYVPTGRHTWAMATLYTFHQGADNVEHFMATIGRDDAHVLADWWIMGYPGTAFRSSVGKSIIAGNRDSLDAAERQCFRGHTVTYLEDIY